MCERCVKSALSLHTYTRDRLQQACAASLLFEIVQMLFNIGQYIFFVIHQIADS